MTLTFPNPSRSYDAAKHCVWFWGYDNAREITFQVGDDMLASLDPEMGPAEREMLEAFDRHRDEILNLARTHYTGGSQNLYTIS
ncbi:DUF1488 domain-containing protein [Cupriavidus sp. RAF12]|uniref:DUF1488 domain-containing protein n=1 Tax=Cupriavidus sp. RAF12 TaxID=3233050 RepID=UPI003F9330F0